MQKRLSIKIMLLGMGVFTVNSFAAAAAAAAEMLNGYEGKDVKQVIKQIGSPDHVADSANGTKIYVWQQTRTAMDYAGENKPGGLVKVGQSECVAQFLVNANGKIVKAMMDGEVLACATLKKKMGLL